MILGHEVVIGEENIDKNLEYTLTIRSIMYNEEDVENIESKLDLNKSQSVRFSKIDITMGALHNPDP